jgi:hypothetical protein
VLYDPLIHLAYDGDTLVYRCSLSRVHNLDRCEVSVMIPLNPTDKWSRSIVGSESNTDVEMMAHTVLNSLWEGQKDSVCSVATQRLC